MIKEVRTEILCPRCKVPMDYLSETEKTSNNNGRSTKITRYYRCPVCGRRIIDEVLIIKDNNTDITIESHTNGARKLLEKQKTSLIK
ncbi:hypothetical protein Calag_0512 [Caldisphaera lagunensis DSM 15908]|uniref:Uncharacterized protein n=1 Tax=Caldisphaera lagunensis (strain DSM 15908 / JCM 11604 / ANMR 0165 / IC-154) TaxID=1056495 RepID=L0A8U9_CALLD|nr:hypothetical protein [Caldisphaera lagunensis]AFZ70276.1 hypothetical protein Calag_0512 [Caldisphaera lagunensis DSM 15908]